MIQNHTCPQHRHKLLSWLLKHQEGLSGIKLIPGSHGHAVVLAQLQCNCSVMIPFEDVDLAQSYVAKFTKVAA